ncbi:hypothetical protein R3P38DRAFT_3240036 [Favolaschia claudopus]|uniref:Transposase n=1 Tax=Favolaschia claudopus TaxID=2862362 RepID=A0AAV9Z7J4_9AGAR
MDLLPAVMPNRSISRDVKIAAVNLYEQDILTLKQILDCVGFSRRTFFRVLRLWRTTGNVVKPRERTGRLRIPHHDDIHYLLELIRNNPHYFLDER